MTYCTRCGVVRDERNRCQACGALPYRSTDLRVPTEYPPSGDLPPFVFAHYQPTMLGLFERERRTHVAFSYITATLLEIRTAYDRNQAVFIQLWSQGDDPKVGVCGPIVGSERQPSIRNIVRVRLGSGAERSFLLTQVKLRANRGDRVTLIFPVPIERAANPVYDYAAIAAVNHVTNGHTWSTTHPLIHAIRCQLPEDQMEPFTDSLGNFLDGLCRRCLRLFAQQSHCRQRPHHGSLSPVR